MGRSDRSTPYHGRTLEWTVAIALMLGIAACGGGGEKQPAAGETGAAAGTQTAAMNAGEQAFQRCATCHLPTGQGMPGVYPPLANSPYANAANPAVPINIVIRGLQGPITVHGETYNSVMPAYGTGVPMSDDEVAAVLTYVRSNFGNSSPPITAQQVAQVRAQIGSNTQPATAAELEPMLGAGGAAASSGGSTTGATKTDTTPR